MFTATSKILIRILLSMMVLSVVAALVLVAALSRGPVSLTFAAPYLNQILDRQYPDLDLQYEALNLIWDGEGKNLVVGVVNMSVRHMQERVAVIPAVTATFSGEALFAGRLAPSGLRFSGLKVLLTRAGDGQLRLGYGYQSGAESGDRETDPPIAADQASADILHQLLAGLGRKSDTGAVTAYLERLEIRQSGFFIEDVKQGRLWRITSADLAVWRSGSGVSARLRGDAHVGGKIINLVANAAYDVAGQTTLINTRIADFPLPLLAGELPELERAAGIDLQVSGDVNIALDADFFPKMLAFDLSTGAGRVTMPDLYHEPLVIEEIHMQGTSEAPFDGVTLQAARIVTAGPHIELSGSLQQTAAGMGLSLRGSIPELLASDLPRYWPYSAASDAYNWVSGNISGGVVHDTTFRIDLPPGALEQGAPPDDSIQLKFRFEGASTSYFGNLPKVTNISGRAVLTEKQIRVSGLSGELPGLTLPEGDVLLRDFDKPDQVADISLKVTGDSRNIFAFLDQDPLNLATPFGVVPAAMQGTGTVTARFVFPLRDDLQLEQVVYSAEGDFTGAFIPDVYDSFDLSDGSLHASVTPQKLEVSGPARINDVPADILYFAWFDGARKDMRRYEVTASLDEDARQRLGFATEYLTGTTAASLGLDISPQGTASGVLSLNLLKAAIGVPRLKLAKPVGEAGLLGARFAVDSDGTTRLSGIHLKSDSVAVTAEATLDAEGLKDLKAPMVQYGRTSLNIDVQRTAPDSFVARIGGSAFDITPLLAEADPASVEAESRALAADEVGPSVNVELDVEEVLMARETRLVNVAANLQLAGERISSGIMTGSFGPDTETGVELRVVPEPGHRTMTFRASDAGLLLNGLDIYENMRGGTVKIIARLDDSAPANVASGTVEMQDVRVVNAPVLAKILTVGSLGGIVDLLNNEGMNFATVEGPFTYNNGLISTEGFRAVGSIGITFTGDVDQNRQTVNGFGTVIPSYTLNSILGNIPILGKLLVGRDGEGIFGFSYKLAGDSDDPEIFVNPVSALAPGILRRMFFEPWAGTDPAETPPDVRKTDDRP